MNRVLEDRWGTPGDEDLKGIRERITARGTDARNRLSGWSLVQLNGFVA